MTLTPKAKYENRISILYSIFGLLFFLLFISCSVPPPDTKEAGLLESLDSMLNREEKPGSILETFYFFRKIYQVRDLVTVLYKGDTIVFLDRKGIPDNKTLLYTIGGSRVKVHQDVYVTTGRNGAWYFSLDSEIWYAVGNNRKKDILNIQYDYPLETRFDRKSRYLEIHYVWAAGKSDSAVPVNMKKKKIVELEENLVFMSTKKKENTLDLNKCFLKIPKDTELIYHIGFSGGLVNSLSNINVTSIKILRDFYVYTSDDSNLKMGISFNNIDWNNNILSFRYIQTGEFISVNRELIVYNRNMELRFSIDEKD